jgi:hypothetical protein
MNARVILRGFVPKIRRLFRPEYDYMVDNVAYARFQVGRFTYGRPLVMFGKEASLKVGSFSSIGDDVDNLLGGNHHADWVSKLSFSRQIGISRGEGKRRLTTNTV